MTSRRGIALLATAASLATLPASADAKPRKAHLTRFGSCSGFVHYARRHALGELRTAGVPVYGSPFPGTRGAPGTAPQAEGAPTAAPVQGQDYSGTNVQEAGVDEPDIVKTDGKTMFVASNGRLFAIDAKSDPPKLLDSIALDGYGQQLLLSGDKLLVLGGAGIGYPILMPGRPMATGRAAAPIAYPASGSTLSEVDVSDPAHMKVLKTMSVNGSYLDARMTGSTARIVFSAIPEAIAELQVAQPDVRPATIGRTTTPSWRPTYKLRRGLKGRATRHALVRCTSIQRPEQFTGLNSLTVLTINIDKGLDPVDSDAIMTDGQTVYASTKNLYVATQKAIVERPAADMPPPDLFTEIHKFDISNPDQTTYVASGVVTGTLLNQYSMSEQGGFLRVASTREPLWWQGTTQRQSESFVTVLGQQAGALTQVGRVGELGKGQRIYSVRFLGDVGYVVTFRQIDPLYTIGLSNPVNPHILGSLDLLGYSAYLHPVGDGLLLGVGQAANDQGRTQGTQLSLFDVSDPANPTRISSQQVGSGSSSTAEFDPHAFLWWAPAKLAVMPVQIYTYDAQKGSSQEFTGAIGFHVARPDGISEAGRVTHPNNGYGTPIDRSLVLGDRLFTVSSLGVKASDLATFADRGFVNFPQPEPQPGPIVYGGTGGSGTGSAPPGNTVLAPPAAP